MSQIYIVYEWYADCEDDSNHIEKTKDIVGVYDSIKKADDFIGKRSRIMKGCWTTWFTVEQHTVR